MWSWQFNLWSSAAAPKFPVSLLSLFAGIEPLIKLYLLRAGEFPGTPLLAPADPATVIRTPLTEGAVGTGMLLAFSLVTCHD